MKNKVKIVDFNRRSMKREDAESQLADMLDEGYSIVAATDNGEFSSYTLVMRQIDLTFPVDEHIPSVNSLVAELSAESSIRWIKTKPSLH